MNCLEGGKLFVYECPPKRRFSRSVLLCLASANMSRPTGSGACLLMCTKLFRINTAVCHQLNVAIRDSLN
jgi:hypothetical protein